MSCLHLIATCAFGLEAVVARELAALGYAGQPGDTGRVHFDGDVAAICRANLWLRTADRVLVRVGEFEASDFGALFDRTRELPWEEWIPPDGAFPVIGRSIRSTLSSVPACQKIVKKAIVERLRHAHGVQDLAETGAMRRVEVALLKDRATLTLDTSGAGLSKRGYRTLVGAAQLRETLAAALVLLSYWRPERALVDPFCGTGTIPIEAALIGRNLAPGLNRAFAAEKWSAIPAARWQEARAEARDLAERERPLHIAGTDASDEALSLARFHARAAGVEAAVHFQKREFAGLESRHEYGCLICNPPYGERMGSAAEVETLYRSIPEVLRRFKTWSHYILSSHPRLEELVGRPADRRRKLYNARIECTYYQFHGPRPPDPERPPPLEAPAERAAFGGISDQGRRQAEEFGNRLAKNARHLRRWPARRGITCYRLYDRDIPEVPLVVDRYHDCLHISEYERPHERGPAEHADWLDLMVETAARTLEVPRANAFLKRRARQRGASQYQVQSTAGRTVVVEEGGLRFEVNLSDYIDTGLFLDHRLTRGLVRERAGGRRFLNLFCYTGTFTVYAAAGGARETTSVDLSRTYLDWARRNLELNGFLGGEHCLVESDARAYLRALPAGRLFDLIVLDPPTFSNSKSLPDFFEVRRDHPELILLALEHLAEGGEVLFATNFRGFKLREDAFAGVAQVEEISARTVPEDFRNRRIHRSFVFRRRG